MKLYRKIDQNTGNFLEDCLFESRPVLDNGEPDNQYIEEAPAQGFYLPRWTGTEWVEGGIAPEPTPPVPTEVERIVAMEEALDFLLMGGM